MIALYFIRIILQKENALVFTVFNTHPCNFTGGKWTTYRHMAEETLDKAIEVCGLKPSKPCQTKGLLLDGAHGWTPTLFIRLVQDFGLENEVKSAFAVNIEMLWNSVHFISYLHLSIVYAFKLQIS